MNDMDEISSEDMSVDNEREFGKNGENPDLFDMVDDEESQNTDESKSENENDSDSNDEDDVRQHDLFLFN
jgi:hypothetical protein